MRNVSRGNYSAALDGAQSQNIVEAAAQDNKTTGGATTEAVAEKVNNTDNNLSLMSWALLFILYLIWSWVDNDENMKSSIKPENIKINVRTMLGVTLAVVVMNNLIKILLGKMAVCKIDIISKIGSALLPLWA